MWPPRPRRCRAWERRIDRLLADTKHDRNTVIDVRGAVVSMNQAFHDFGLGLIIAVLLVYLILMAQFTSFIDPFIILMAIPPGLAGVVLILLLTGSTLNIMSLMGVIMMAGIVVSNSILIVEFAGILHKQGLPLLEAVVESCKVRLRPILMTSLATLLGMIPMALGLEAGSEQYAPLARAIIGGLALSVVVTVFLVPAVYLVIHGRREAKTAVAEGIDHDVSAQTESLHVLLHCVVILQRWLRRCAAQSHFADSAAAQLCRLRQAAFSSCNCRLHVRGRAAEPVAACWATADARGSRADGDPATTRTSAWRGCWRWRRRR